MGFFFIDTSRNTDCVLKWFHQNPTTFAGGWCNLEPARARWPIRSLKYQHQERHSNSGARVHEGFPHVDWQWSRVGMNKIHRKCNVTALSRPRRRLEAGRAFIHKTSNKKIVLKTLQTFLWQKMWQDKKGQSQRYVSMWLNLFKKIHIWNK